MLPIGQKNNIMVFYSDFIWNLIQIAKATKWEKTSVLVLLSHSILKENTTTASRSIIHISDEIHYHNNFILKTATMKVIYTI